MTEISSSWKFGSENQYRKDSNYYVHCDNNLEVLKTKVELLMRSEVWQDKGKEQALMSIWGTAERAIVNATAKSLQSCPTLCDPIDGSLPSSPVPGILQAKTLEWVAISFSNAWKWKVKVKSLSRARLFATPWTAAYQAPPSMGFSRQEYWSGVPLPSPVEGLSACNSSLLSFQLFLLSDAPLQRWT